MRRTQSLKYLTLWKDGRWVFMKREDERQGFIKKITKWVKRLIKLF